MRNTSSSAGTGYIKCPFFVAHGDREIICESITPAGKSCITRFRHAEDKTFHQTTYCEREFRRCEICLSILHWKWEDSD